MGTRKIAFIITKLELGGAQKSVLYTARNLDKTKFEPYLLSGPGGYFDTETKLNIKNVFFIKNLVRAIRPFKDLKATLEIKNILNQINPDIVHTNSSKAGITGRLAALLAKKRPKIVHTVHGFGFNDRQNAVKRNFYIFLERFFAKYTDALVFVSLQDLKTALQLNIATPDKCQIIRAGVELKTKEDFKNFNRQEKLKSLGLPQDGKIVLSIANLKPQKNPLDMVKAARIVCSEFPQTVFLYLGTGELKNKTEALISKYNLNSNFKLLGHRDDTAELLAIADVFALSSLWEGLPMALIEALSMQVPAVCYDAGGIGEVLESDKNGFIVERGNYARLAHGIMKVLSGEFKNYAVPDDVKEFDIKEMLNKQQELYTHLGDN